MIKGIIGATVVAEFPINNEETKKIEGVVVDKFNNGMSFSAASGIEREKLVEDFAINYDNYLLVEKDGTAHTIHPTLIKSIKLPKN